MPVDFFDEFKDLTSSLEIRIYLEMSAVVKVRFGIKKVKWIKQFQTTPLYFSLEIENKRKKKTVGLHSLN